MKKEPAQTDRYYYRVCGDRNFYRRADNVFEYTIIKVDTLEPTAAQRMITGPRDMTLFTCTIGGASCVTVRCCLTEECAFDFNF